MKNKKALLGGETVMWGWRLLLIGVILLGFIIVISSFYSAKYDVRPIESAVLARRIRNCIASNGIVTLDVFNGAKVEECAGLSKDEIKELYTGAVLSYSNSSNFTIGDSNLEALCWTEGKYTPYCLNQKYYLLLEQNGNLERARLNLLIAINKIEKNV